MKNLTKCEMFELFEALIDDFVDLRNIDWFLSNDDLHKKLLTIIQMDLYESVCVGIADSFDGFSEHLDLVITDGIRRQNNNSVE